MKERSSALGFENDLFDFGGQRHYEIIQFNNNNNNNNNNNGGKYGGCALK